VSPVRPDALRAPFPSGNGEKLSTTTNIMMESTTSRRKTFLNHGTNVTPPWRYALALFVVTVFFAVALEDDEEEVRDDRVVLLLLLLLLLLLILSLSLSL
jgi:hypothetical protein